MLVGSSPPSEVYHILSPGPDSLDTSEVITTFSHDNAARLALSPTALAACLTRAERLQRCLSRGSQAGQWVPSRSVRLTGDPALIASIITANHAVLGFHSVEVRKFSLPILHCFHCGVAGARGPSLSRPLPPVRPTPPNAALPPPTCWPRPP